MRPLFAVLLAGGVLGGCVGDPSTRYAGMVSGCGIDRQGVMTVVHGQVAFTPDEGTWVLRGTIGADGAIAAAAVADATGKARRAGSFAGRLDGDVISGTLSGPGCSATVALHRVVVGLSRTLPSGSMVEDLLK